MGDGTGSGTSESAARRRWRDTTAEASAAVLAAVVEHAGLGIALVGLDGIPFQANPAFERMMGYSENELLAMSLDELTHPDDLADAAQMFAELVSGERETYRIETRYVRKDGGLLWGALTMSAVRRGGRGLLFAVGLVEDVTDRRLLQDDLRHQALHDHLTGLPNRRLFEDRLQRAVQVRRRPDHGLAVLALDLNGFKRVNDTLGHAAGDEVLRAVAQRLLGSCRETDTVARLGGDEFVVLCAGRDIALHAVALADRFRAALAAPVLLSDGSALAVSASIGIAVAASGDHRDLLRRADAAMYEQKSAHSRR